MRTCRHLPWKHYLKLLTQFMQRLSSASVLQEHLLRTVVNVLDVFHFDLKMSATINQYGEGSALQSRSIASQALLMRQRCLLIPDVLLSCF